MHFPFSPFVSIMSEGAAITDYVSQPNRILSMFNKAGGLSGEHGESLTIKNKHARLMERVHKDTSINHSLKHDIVTYLHNPTGPTLQRVYRHSMHSDIGESPDLRAWKVNLQ